MGAVTVHDEQRRQARRVARGWWDVRGGSSEQTGENGATGLAGTGGCVMGGGDRWP